MKKNLKTIVNRNRHNYKRKLIKSSLILFAFFLMTAAGWMVEKVKFSRPALESNENIQFFSTDEGQLEKIYTKSIYDAKDSIVVMIFSLTNNRVIHALKQKSEEGIKVKVICDAKACPHIEKKLGNKVELIKRLDKGLMHLKIVVVDEVESILGSANLTGESLNMHGNLVVKIKDQALANILIKKSMTLNEYDRDGKVPYTELDVGGQEMELSFLPDDKLASQRIKNLIRSANKTIKVAMFTWTREDFAKEIIKAKDRGVLVSVVLDRNSANNSSSIIAKLLKNNGVNVNLSVGNALLHHKFMIVDDNVLEIGSANWTKSAFNVNDDCFLIIHQLTEDQQLKLKELWDETLYNSTPYQR